MGSQSHQTVGALASERVPLPSPSRIIVPSRTIGSAVPVYFFWKYLVDQPPLTAALVRVEQRGKTPKYVGGCCQTQRNCEALEGLGFQVLVHNSFGLLLCTCFLGCSSKVTAGFLAEFVIADMSLIQYPWPGGDK